MALSGYHVYAVTTVAGPSQLQPQKCKGVCKMENKKSKGGAEKARIKKRKALETDAAKCAKICSFFNKTSSQSETTNDDDETGKDKMLNKMQLYLHY